ncbi:MAG: hypothetical protein RIE22_08290, partial [Alphaproteobacteria bacterium]
RRATGCPQGVCGRRFRLGRWGWSGPWLISLINMVPDGLCYVKYIMPEIWHRGNVVFGPGLIEAHCLEQKVAKFPRIIFSESVNELLQELNNKEFKFYEKDYDGKYFVNVFSEPLWRSGYEKQTGMAFGSNLQLCENVVKGRQKTEDQGIEEKWCWLQEKWARAASD